MLVLGALGFRDRKETDVLQLICSVSPTFETFAILEDEDDSSNSEFGFKAVGPSLWAFPSVPWHARPWYETCSQRSQNHNREKY